MNKIVKIALLNSLATVVYVELIVLFMSFMQTRFSSSPETFFIPIAMLLLFVFSAALTGSLVFGKPLMLYLDGKKKDALKLISWTLTFLFLILIITIAL